MCLRVAVIGMPGFLNIGQNKAQVTRPVLPPFPKSVTLVPDQSGIVNRGG